GMTQSMENAIRSLSAVAPVERRGRLGALEIIHVAAGAPKGAHGRTQLPVAAPVPQKAPPHPPPAPPGPLLPLGTIYLAFGADLPDESKQAVLDEYGLQLVAAEPNGFVTVRTTKPGTDSVEIAAKLQRDKRIATAEPDLLTTTRFHAFVRPTDELLPLEWHLENTGRHGGQTIGYKQGADARVIAAWRALGGLGSSDVVIGIIDDGFDLAHPDLSDKSVEPWDFDRNSEDVRPEPNLTSPDLGNWHGTACAGVAAGRAGGGQIVGAAPNAKMMPGRMRKHLCPTQDAEWCDHMTEKGAWIVSCSWGAEAAIYPLPDRIAHAIERCARQGRNGKGCVVVFAAGNTPVDINETGVSQNGLATHPD